MKKKFQVLVILGRFWMSHGLYKGHFGTDLGHPPKKGVPLFWDIRDISACILRPLLLVFILVKGDTGPSADPVPLWDPRFLAGFDPKNSFTFFSFGLKPFTPNPTSLLVLP